jgi:iron complex outermembrane recepter protein
MSLPKFNSTHCRLTFLVSGLAIAVAAPAMAQTAAPAAAPAANPDGIEVVIVSAQKVLQNLQDVPIAVSALTGTSLANAPPRGVEGLLEMVPSLTLRKGTSQANSAVFLRGVGTITFSLAAEPSVSTVVDGIVLSRSGQAFTDFMDVERIEVLRGPQGTLFGKNASAGLINIISKGGTKTFEGELNLSAYQGNEYRSKLSISGPLADNLAGRLTGSYSTYDGNITNVFSNKKINGYEHSSLRGLLDWKLSDGAKFRFIADYAKADDNCCGEVTGATRGAVVDAEMKLPGGVALAENQRFVNHNLESKTIGDQWSLTAQGDFKVLGDHQLTAIAGYRSYANTEIREGDFLPRPIVGTAQLHDNGYQTAKQSSLELRLASNQSQTLVYQVGAFYWQSDNTDRFTRQDITCTTSTLPVDPLTGGTPCNQSDTVNTLFPTATSSSTIAVKNYALFGQSTYNFSDELRFTGGLRWTRDTVSYVHTRAPAVNATTGLPAVGPALTSSPAGGLIASGGNGTNVSSDASSNNNFSGKAVAQYDLSNNIVTYGSYTRGYKGPAFNVFFNHTRPVNSTPVDEETSDAFELGMKSMFANQRIQLNVAVFQADYKGFQAANFVLLNGGLITNLTNAGKVRTKGIEIDALAKPTRDWDINFNLAYADARVRVFNPNPLTNAPDARNGTRLPLSPKLNVAMGTGYESSFAAGGMSVRMYLRTTYNWTGKQFSDLGESGPVNSYGLWNASVGFSDQKDMYRLTFLARNITDKSYILLNTTNFQRLHIPRDADRHFGVNLVAKFR